MVDNLVTLTIVQFDLVDSTRFWDGIRKMGLGSETVRLVVEKIEQTIRNAFDETVNGLEVNHKLTKILNCQGDGGTCIFESLEAAYKFVEIFSTLVDKYNQNPNIDKWLFRISEVTDKISYDESKFNKMVGYIFVEAKVLEAGAYPGWLFVDRVTYDHLSQDIKDRRKFSQENFKTKHGEPKQAWGCPMFSNAEKPQPKLGNLAIAIEDSFPEPDDLEMLLFYNSESIGIKTINKVAGNNDKYPVKIRKLLEYLIANNKIRIFIDIAQQSNSAFGDRC
jgi:hypothetical protein